MDIYQKVFLQLLPSGAAWNKAPDSTFCRLAGGLSDIMASADSLVGQMLTERFPSTATLLLDDWEAFLGLPYCTSESGTVHARQNGAAIKMRMVGSLNRRFYEELAASYGFKVSLTDSEDGQFTTDVNVLSGVSFRNATVLDSCLTPLRVYDSGGLECLLEKYKPAHQIYKFIYPDTDEE